MFTSGSSAGVVIPCVLKIVLSINLALLSVIHVIFCGWNFAKTSLKLQSGVECLSVKGRPWQMMVFDGAVYPDIGSSLPVPGYLPVPDCVPYLCCPPSIRLTRRTRRKGILVYLPPSLLAISCGDSQRIGPFDLISRILPSGSTWLITCWWTSFS
jgi:hypothetical protein